MTFRAIGLTSTALVLGLAGGAALAEEPPKPAESPAATEPAKPATPAAQPKEFRSKITDGSYRLDPYGHMRMEYAFEGEEPIIDMKAGAILVVKSGMTKEEFKKAVVASGVTMTQLSENEFQIGGNEVVIFVDGKLARMRK